MNKYEIFRLTLNFFEFLAFVTGLFFISKLKYTYWKWFVVYLGIIVFAELFSEFRQLIQKKPNQWLYVWFIIPFEFLFFYWLYFKYFRYTEYRRWPLIMSIIYAAAYIIDMTYLRHMQFAFSSFSYLAGTVLLLILILLFFARLAKGYEAGNFKKDIMFWVSTGLLIFFLGSLPFYGLWNTIRVANREFFNSYWMVQMTFNCLMYLFFTLSFVWGKPK